jgi:hypothetical protein
MMSATSQFSYNDDYYDDDNNDDDDDDEMAMYGIRRQSKPAKKNIIDKDKGAVGDQKKVGNKKTEAVVKTTVQPAALPPLRSRSAEGGSRSEQNTAATSIHGSPTKMIKASSEHQHYPPSQVLRKSVNPDDDEWSDDSLGDEPIEAAVPMSNGMKPLPLQLASPTRYQPSDQYDDHSVVSDVTHDSPSFRSNKEKKLAARINFDKPTVPAQGKPTQAGGRRAPAKPVWKLEPIACKPFVPIPPNT